MFELGDSRRTLILFLARYRRGPIDEGFGEVSEVWWRSDEDVTRSAGQLSGLVTRRGIARRLGHGLRVPSVRFHRVLCRR